MSNLDKYKNDLDELIEEGGRLLNAMQFECYPEQFEIEGKKAMKDDYDEYVKKLKPFVDGYQEWYSESTVLLKQLLPDRLADFEQLYNKPKTRKELTVGSYVIHDYLQGLSVTSGPYKTKIVGPNAAIPQFKQQLAIVKSIRRRFKSSLFDIRQLTQADLFDSELSAANELNKKGFARGAGAVAGVVIEKHLLQVCTNHNIAIKKKNPSISDFNDILKSREVYETATWRKIQHLGDLRNLCDHNKDKEPTQVQVGELIEGVNSLIKTVF